MLAMRGCDVIALFTKMFDCPTSAIVHAFVFTGRAFFIGAGPMAFALFSDFFRLFMRQTINSVRRWVMLISIAIVIAITFLFSLNKVVLSDQGL